MTDEPLIPNPEGLVAGDVLRPGPDVTSRQIAGAGATQEAIETDYWFLTDRQFTGYRNDAYAVAKELGFGIPDPDIAFQPAVTQEQIDLQNSILQSHEANIYDAILQARERHPEAFEGKPVTHAEIMAQVNGELRAEYDEAQRVLDLAPDTFFGRMVPEFLGRMGTAATDEINAPLTIATLGLGTQASLGRIMLMESGLSILGEAGTLPDQFEMAERLDLPAPNVPAQLALAGAAGAAFPAAIRGGGKVLQLGGRAVDYTNSRIVSRLRKRASDLTPEQRAAVDRMEAQIAEQDVGPSSRAAEQLRETDAAIQDIDAGLPPATDVPTPDTARVERLTTPPKDAGPRPEAPAPARAPDPDVQLSLEASLGGLIRDSEARGGYDTPSDFTVIASEKPLTQMTLDEVDAWQTANRSAGAESTAAGGYQIIRKTLRSLRAELGLTGSEIFDENLQDRLGMALMERRGLSSFRAGDITIDQFADNLAQEWAALPLAGGKSFHAGDGLNKATIDRDTVLSVLSGQTYESDGRPPPVMTRVASAGVRADPHTYQFRSNVDERGVGNPLSRVTEWDELLAGDFIIHERFDGTRYVADGHHRLDLAGRLQASGHAPIDFNAFVLREADGYSIEHVRAIAAVKNIEAGNASAVDAAKVLRLDPEMLAKLTLRSSMARDARGLMRLSDDSFDMVTNRLIDEPHAAFVGELTDDFDMQDAIMRTLIQAKPRTQTEARQIAQDAYRAGLALRDANAQDSLFGDDFDLQQTLFKERAAVLARALSQLRQDKRVFATLVKEQDRIKEAGNALTTQTNQARLTTDETALALIEKLVNRAGPLDDALNAAAGKAQRGGIQFGVRDFLGIVRDAIEGGNLRRLLDGADGGNPDTPAPHGLANESAGPGGSEAGRLADAFDDPASDAPAVRNQTEAAQNDILAGLDAGEDLQIPTGREVNGEAELVSIRDVLSDHKEDEEFLEMLDACKS
ncbi:hypothetical protein [uncultured Ruegeria sp.]|uniref:hypothetical protein n=1 Tax=uncultured Ruegeria sp. TaxID=259304 RepID=UPI00261229EE|nr:hypothetical protein [uncultured Ruegeria sp.]